MAFFNGPLNKSIYTQQFELFAKCLLAYPNAIHFGYQFEAGKKQLFGYLNNSEITVNISKFLKKSDFTDMELNESDNKNFFKHYAKNDNAYLDTRNTYQYDKEGQCPEFMHAEYSAIKNYTGSGYISVNKMMYANGTNYTESNGKMVDADPALDIIKTAFISSGLNKIMPDPSSSDEMKSYRGEHSTSQEEIQKRIDSIQDPDSFIETPAYMSTSSDKNVARDFSGGVLIKFEGLYGKSIECISHFPHEKEFLLQPSKIQWFDYNEKKISEHASVHEFKARVVNPLIPGENDPDFNDIEAFKNLVDWAEKNKIDTGFITPFNQRVYLSDCLCDEDLDLEDWIACVVEKTLTHFFDEFIDFGNLLCEAIDEVVEEDYMAMESFMFIPDFSAFEELAELNCIMI